MKGPLGPCPMGGGFCGGGGGVPVLSRAGVPAGTHWGSLKRGGAAVGCSLLEAQSGESEEAETVTAMALLSVGAERGGTDPNPRYGLGIWGGVTWGSGHMVTPPL